MGRGVVKILQEGIKTVNTFSADWMSCPEAENGILYG